MFILSVLDNNSIVSCSDVVDMTANPYDTVQIRQDQVLLFSDVMTVSMGFMEK